MQVTPVQDKRKGYLGDIGAEITPDNEFFNTFEDAQAALLNSERNFKKWGEHFGWNHDAYKDYWQLRSYADDYGLENLHPEQEKRFKYLHQFMDTEFRDPKEGPAYWINPLDKKDVRPWKPGPMPEDAFTKEEIIRFFGSGNEKQSMLDETWGKNKGYRLG